MAICDRRGRSGRMGVSHLRFCLVEQDNEQGALAWVDPTWGPIQLPTRSLGDAAIVGRRSNRAHAATRASKQGKRNYQVSAKEASTTCVLQCPLPRSESVV